jgi:hypothetical protein
VRAVQACPGLVEIEFDITAVGGEQGHDRAGPDGTALPSMQQTQVPGPDVDLEGEPFVLGCKRTEREVRDDG